MRGLEDLITDIASIVTACRRGEIMTVKKVEEGYRLIYGCSIPYHEYGYSTLEKLLEDYPNHFNFSTADGILIIRTNMRTNITDLISADKLKSNTTITSPTNCLFKKHKRKEIHTEAHLPVVTLKNISDMLKRHNKPMKKHEFLNYFQSICGYPLKYLDYGFIDLDHVLNTLNGHVFSVHRNMIYEINTTEKSIYDYFIDILVSDTGFSVSAIQDSICQISQHKISELMKSEGFVNFIDLIYEANKRKILSFDFDLIYPFTDRVALSNPFYPDGICQIRFINVNSPSDFYFTIVCNAELPALEFIDSQMRQMSSTMKLLSLFKQHKLCAVEYDSMWYRARIVGLSCEKNFECLSLRFIDHPIEIENGIQISLPTDRLRFLPPQLETIPAYIHKGSLAYVKPIEGHYKWHKEACDRFHDLVTDEFRSYYSYLTGQTEHGVSVDVVSIDCQGVKGNVFHELIKENVARINWK